MVSGAQLISIVVVGIALALTFVALVTLLAAVLKGQTKRGREAIRDNPVRTILVGLIAWLVFGSIAFWLYAQAHLVAACIAVLLPMLVNLLGAPGLYSHIGDRIAALRKRQMSDLGCVMSGTLLALLAACFPIFGWFLVLPLLLFAEFGAGFQALLRR